MIMGREDRMRKYNLKSALKDNEITPTESDTSTANSEDYSNYDSSDFRKVRVIDRFGMILQIFAARAKSQIAQI